MATKVKSKKSPGGGEGHLFAVRILEKFIGFIKGLLTGKLLDFSIKWLTLIGHIGLIVAAVLGFLFFIIAAIRVPAGAGTLILYAIIWVIVVFVLQYTAYRFLPAGDNLIKNNPTRLASKAFLDCVGFLAMLAGIVALFYHIYLAIKLPSLSAFLTGLGMFVFLEFIALIAFNVETASMEIVGEASAGQEAIGIVTFFMKTLLRLVPIIFGLGIAVFTVIMFIDSFGLFSDTRISAALASGTASAIMIAQFTLLPIASYILFVLFFLIIDIIRAILAIPEKLDNLKK
ncbi:MAG: hypothetical protein KAT34_18195 [Candidatus Aminicenantes bacterium]|nr:hypothetical protein [Candidatus Aminicenantes bacterium]